MSDALAIALLGLLVPLLVLVARVASRLAVLTRAVEALESERKAAVKHREEHVRLAAHFKALEREVHQLKGARQ